MKDDLLDAVVDGWKILIKVGQGASGSVYEARKGHIRAALKIIRPDLVSATSLARFKREAHLLMEVNHAHVVGCMGAGETEGFVYLALEFVEGGSLDAYLDRRGKFSVAESVGIINDLLEGLTAIHEKGIVHRDIKPGNVLLDARGAVKLADFNLARGDNVDMQVTTDGTIVGTPFYMAPEQIEGKEHGPPTDLYSVGALMFHLVTGRPPYEGSSSLAILQKHLSADVPDPREVDPDLPEQIGAFVAKLMCKAHGDRPGSAAEAKVLLEGLPTKTLVVETRQRPRGRRPPQRGGRAASTSSRRVQRPPGAKSKSTTGHRRPPPADDRRGSGSHPVAGSGRRRRRPSSDTHPVPPGRRPGPPPARGRRGETPGTEIPLSLQETSNMDRATLRESAAQAQEDGKARKEVKTSRRRLAPQAPLPRVKRSKLMDGFVLLVALLAALYAWDIVQRAGGGHPLETLRQRLGGQEQIVLVISKARDALDQQRPLGLLIVLLLVFDRVLSRATRVGIFGRLVLGHRASKLVGAGEIHQAAKVYEQLGKRLRAGDLLSQHDMHVLAAQFYEAGGYVALQAAALTKAGKQMEALAVLKDSGSPEAALAMARLGDTSLASAELLAERGFTDEAIAAHSKGGRHYEAAALLEGLDRLAQAVDELEAGYGRDKGGREYWHFNRKHGLLEQAKPRLAQRIAELHMGLGDTARAASYFERAGEADHAANLYLEVGDHHGRARCLLHGIPPKGKLTPKQCKRLESAAGSLALASDPQAVALYSRAGNVGLAAEECLVHRDYPQAAQLFARAGRHAEGADCAAKAGNRQLAAFLYDEGGFHAQAITLYEQLGQLQEAVDVAERAGDFDAQARLYPKLGNHLAAARAFHRLGKAGIALKALSRVAKQSDEWTDARVLAAEIHFKAGRHREAAQGFADGLHPQIDLKEEVGPTLNFATSLEALGRLDEALKVLGRFKGREKLAPKDLAARCAALATKASKQSKKASRPVARPAGKEAGLAATTDPVALVGEMIDRYELTALLEDGTFTWVYKARHTRLDRETVLKVLKPARNTRGAGPAFLEGGRVLIGKDNKHLLEVYDGGESRGLCYLAFEYVPGPNLEELISREGPLPVPRAARLGAGIISALSAAHKAGVTHHDLRPTRVQVAPGSLAKVCDFGVAKVFEDLDGSASFVDPRYCSPEQALGDDAGPAADQYAVGLILYKMLTGKLPFQSKSPRGFWALHANEPPTPIGRLRRDLPAPLAKAIMRSLAKSPSSRFKSVGDFGRAVAAFAGKSE